MNTSDDMDMFQAFSDGLLADDQAKALLDRLGKDQQFCRNWIRFFQDEAILQEWAKTLAANECVERKAEVLSHRQESRFRDRLIVLGAASVLLAVVGAYLALQWISALGPERIPPIVQETPENEGKDSRVPIGNLEDSQGEVFVESDEGKRLLAKGQTLFEGQKLSTRGEDSYAVVTMVDSTRLEVGKDTILTMPKKGAEDREIALQVGTIAAKMAPQPKGRPMAFRTPHVSFVSASSVVNVQTLDDETHIEPEVGSVDMTTIDGTRIEVHAGNTAVVSKNGRMVGPSHRKKVANKKNSKKG